MGHELAKVRQSAVLPFRWRKGRLELLLVTSLDTGRWVVPKGNIAPDHTPRESAEKEAFEEAGIRGAVSKKDIGHYAYKKADVKGGAICRVELFPMRVETVEDDWPEQAMRRRKWMPVERAAAAVAEPRLSELMLAFADTAEPE